MNHEEVIMTLTLLLKALELAPEAIKALQGDVSAIVADKTDAARVNDAIKLVEDGLNDLKALLS